MTYLFPPHSLSLSLTLEATGLLLRLASSAFTYVWEHVLFIFLILFWPLNMASSSHMHDTEIMHLVLSIFFSLLFCLIPWSRDKYTRIPTQTKTLACLGTELFFRRDTCLSIVSGNPKASGCPAWCPGEEDWMNFSEVQLVVVDRSFYLN